MFPMLFFSVLAINNSIEFGVSIKVSIFLKY